MLRKSSPFARPRAPRRSLGVALLIAACAAATASGPSVAHAQQTIVNFNTLTVTDGSGFRSVNNCYQESGFQITAVGIACGTANAFATAGSDDPTLWTGSPALYLNDPVATTVSFSRVGGGLFSMQSIMFAPFLNYTTTPGSIMLMGLLANGATVSQTCGVPVSAGITALQQPLQTCTLGSAFTGLTAVRFASVTANGVLLGQFDNAVFTPAATAVPEPGTVALVASGLLALGAVVRRRRSPM